MHHFLVSTTLLTHSWIFKSIQIDWATRLQWPTSDWSLMTSLEKVFNSCCMERRSPKSMASVHIAEAPWWKAELREDDAVGDGALPAPGDTAWAAGCRFSSSSCSAFFCAFRRLISTYGIHMVHDSFTNLIWPVLRFIAFKSIKTSLRWPSNCTPLSRSISTESS